MADTAVPDGKQYIERINLYYDKEGTIQDFILEAGMDDWEQTRNSLERNIQREFEKRIGHVIPNMIVPNPSNGDSPFNVTAAGGLVLNIAPTASCYCFIRGSLCLIPSMTHTMDSADGDYYLALELVNPRSAESFRITSFPKSDWSGKARENFILLAEINVSSGTATVTKILKKYLGHLKTWTVTADLEYDDSTKDRLYFTIDDDVLLVGLEMRLWMKKAKVHSHGVTGSTGTGGGSHSHDLRIWGGIGTTPEADIWMDGSISGLIAAGFGVYPNHFDLVNAVL